MRWHGTDSGSPCARRRSSGAAAPFVSEACTGAERLQCCSGIGESRHVADDALGTAARDRRSSWQTAGSFVAFGGGAGLAAAASSSYSDGKAKCTAAGCGPSAQDAANRAGTLADFGTAAFIAGGVLVAAAAVTWFSAPVHRTQVALAPLFGPVTGLFLRGDL